MGQITQGREMVRALRKQTTRPSHGVKVGDIFYASWGYNQTNVNFYQVKRLVGRTMVEVQEIASKIKEDHTYHYDVVAVPNAFKEGEKVMRKRVKTSSYSGRPAIKVYEFANASLWDGQPKYETGWGFGH